MTELELGDQSTSDTDSEWTRVLVAECPMSWCQFTAVIEDPDTDYDTALEIQDHVNENHSEKDIDTLGHSVDTNTDRSENGDDT